MQFYCSSVSLTPMSLAGSLRAAQEAGFDGLEVLLAPGMDHEKVLGISPAFGLSWHEVWSLENDPTQPMNYLAALLGKIPRRTEGLDRQLPTPTLFKNPVVCYPNRIAETSNWKLHRKDLLQFQTCRPHGVDMRFEQFVQVVWKENLKVVFDTQHALEWKLRMHGVEEMKDTSSSTLMGYLKEMWETLGEYVTEIHLNDFNPSLGHTNGRNCFPGTGVLDLREFAGMVKQSGWQGIVVPEVAPHYLYPYKIPCTPFGVPFRPRLKELLEVVTDMFA